MTNMIPGLWMILVSIFLPVIPQYFRQPVMLLSVAASALSLLNGFGVFVEWEILGNTLILYQADNLTLPFALIFHLASVLVIIYGWHNKNLMENMATLAYAGAAIGAVHAGDFFSLFIWWEETPSPSSSPVEEPKVEKSHENQPKNSEPAISNFDEQVDKEGERSVPMSKLRQTIARRLKDAQNTAAILTTFNEVDMTAIMALRKKQQAAFQKKHGVKLGIMSFFVKACVQVLRNYLK